MYVTRAFEENCWTARQEVSPRESEDQADLIVSHEQYGWFGIETKHLYGDGGGTIAEAHHQIKKISRNGIFRWEDRPWAICPYLWGINSPDYPQKISDSVRGKMEDFGTNHDEIFRQQC